MTIPTATLGYPRIGRNREVKKALEAFWSRKSAAETLLQTVREVELANWKTQLGARIDRIGIGDTTLYDHVLDWSVRLGLIPDRFRHLSGLDQYSSVHIDSVRWYAALRTAYHRLCTERGCTPLYFAMARDKDGIPALEMTKWFDTNYHYLVPEIDRTYQPADFGDFLETVHRAQTLLGDHAVPILLGPLTLLRLNRLELNLEQTVSYLCDRYLVLLSELKNLGVVGVQIHTAGTLAKCIEFRGTETGRGCDSSTDIGWI